MKRVAKIIFRSFSNTMKINLLTSNYQNSTPNFGAKTPKIKPVLFHDLQIDTLELSKNIEQILPERFEFGELEIVAKDLWTKIVRLELNARTFRDDLKYYYTSQNKDEYKELLKEKQKANAQFSNLAKKIGVDKYELAKSIKEKKEYNFFAPKIYRATTLEELNNLIIKIKEQNLYKTVQTMLFELIEYRKSLIK